MMEKQIIYKVYFVTGYRGDNSPHFELEERTYITDPDGSNLCGLNDSGAAIPQIAIAKGIFKFKTLIGLLRALNRTVGSLCHFFATEQAALKWKRKMEKLYV